MKIFIPIVISFFLSSCSVAGSNGDNNIVASHKQAPGSFSFLFMCDIHLHPDSGAVEGFKKAIDTANKLRADFVLTGGDLVFDALGVSFARADSLFQLYKKTIALFTKPVYNTIGNHDVFGIYPESKVSKAHPDYKYGMYQRYLGDTYYSFDHKGWHFVVMNSVGEKDGKYIGIIEEEQKSWLEQDLSKIHPQMPIAVVVHIPFLSTYYQRYKRAANPRSPEGAFITNRNEVLNMFDKHNLKLVLQGHTHWIEDINIKNKIRFITGGSISGHSWRGNKDVEKGFMKFSVKEEDISWEYIDYGWNTINAGK